MKHNTWIYKFIFSLLVIASGSHAFAKIINSEFLNQAAYGSEGPQIVELELAGTRTYMLTYTNPGKQPLFRNLTQKEYLKLQADMRRFLKNADDDKKTKESCEREITYTKVVHENKVSNSSLCWGNLGSKKRLQLSNWFIDVRKSLQ